MWTAGGPAAGFSLLVPKAKEASFERDMIRSRWPACIVSFQNDPDASNRGLPSGA
jgi:hypothetical protein